MEPEELLAEARAQTGLDDFGGDGFREGLDVLCAALGGQARLNEVGEIGLREQLVRLLVNRLEVQDWTTRHPEILSVDVGAPLVVVGFPRTGTTLLSFLLDADPANRSLYHWEATMPCPPPDEGALRSDPRIEASDLSLELLYGMAPAMRYIHPMEARGPTECVTLFAHEFRSIHFETLVNVPGYGSWLLDGDLDPAYTYHRRLLQLLGWRSARERWSLKSPGHLLGLPELLATYPGAKVVFTHRDPRKVMGSVASLVTTLRGVFSDALDPKDVGRRWLELLGACMDRAMDARARLDPDAFHDVAYADLVADPIGTVRATYERFGYPWDFDVASAMQAWMDDHPADKHGVHRYTLEDFGLHPEEVDERFAVYRETYGVATEV